MTLYFLLFWSTRYIVPFYPFQLWRTTTRNEKLAIFSYFLNQRWIIFIEDVENVTADQEIDGSSLKKKTDK